MQQTPKEHLHHDTQPPAPPDAPRDELTRLASEAAHQIKAPLSAVQTILATLLGGYAGPLQPRQRDLLEKAIDRCASGVKVVRDLVRLRSLAALSDDAIAPVDVAGAFDAVRERYRDSASDRDIEFTTRTTIEGPDRWTRGQAELIQEAIAVVVDNAIKYTPRGGRVTASLGRLDQPDTAPMIALEVVDSGVGIPAGAYERLFREFYRAPSAKRLNTEGSGLGLAFAFRALHRFGGTIRLGPADTGGVRALVCLPLVPVETPDADPGATARLPSSRTVSRRVVIVGGIAAGPKTAARLMRLDPDADVTVVDRGRFLAYSGCALPGYVSGSIAEQRTLLETPLGIVRDSSFFHSLKNVRSLDLTEAIAIDRHRKTVRVRQVTGGERDLAYDQLVLATGVRFSEPPLPGIALDGIYRLQGIQDAELLRNRLRSLRVQDVVIVGGGLLGSQITEAVAMRGARLTLVEAEPTLLRIVDDDIALLAQRHVESHGVRVLTGIAVVGFAGESTVREVLLADGRRLACDLVILATGQRPETALGAAAGLDVGPSGGYRVDQHLRTNDPDIFAVGDCAEHAHVVSGRPAWYPGAAPATVQGRIAASSICGLDESYPGTLGTLIVKLFDATLGRTGLTAAQALDAGFTPVSALVPGLDHAHFVPDAQHILVKLTADLTSRRVLGAQFFGVGRVDKRLDVLATAIASGLDLDALAHLNLGYAPSYSLAMDVVLAAANVLRNKIDGRFDGISSSDLRAALAGPTPPVVIDVRLPSEYGRTRLPGSRHVPLGALRSRTHELTRDDTIVLVCTIGLRSYEASIVLRADGFDRVRVLEGGLEAWPFELERLD